MVLFIYLCDFNNLKEGMADFNKDVASVFENLCIDAFSGFFLGRLFLIGLGLGPALHFWYKFLDKRLPGANALSVAKKVFLDISIASPICIAYFFIG